MFKSLILLSILAITPFLAGCNNKPRDVFDAAGTGNLSELQSFIDADPSLINSLDNIGEAPLHVAAKYGQVKSVNKLLELGADINVQTRIAFDTPLHYAIMFGKPEVVSALLDKKPDLTMTNAQGEAAIDVANSHQGEGSAKIRDLIAAASGAG